MKSIGELSASIEKRLRLERPRASFFCLISTPYKHKHKIRLRGHHLRVMTVERRYEQHST